MKKYNVTVSNKLLSEDRIVPVTAKSAQDAHKEMLFGELTEYDEITEIRNEDGVLVYGTEGFVNVYRDA
jgi:hypothetical protein